MKTTFSKIGSKYQKCLISSDRVCDYHTLHDFCEICQYWLPKICRQALTFDNWCRHAQGKNLDKSCVVYSRLLELFKLTVKLTIQLFNISWLCLVDVKKWRATPGPPCSFTMYNIKMDICNNHTPCHHPHRSWRWRKGSQPWTSFCSAWAAPAGNRLF